MIGIRVRAASGLLCAVSFLALTSPALGQAAAPANAPVAAAPDEAKGVADIIVTAQKREQRLSDVPVTITTATGDQLKTSGVTDVQQIGKIAPSFTSSASVFGYQVFSIRGVNFNTQQASAPPAVAVYVDQAPLPYSAMTNGLLLDVERIEVLKGPQGTLFGQNATGGLINVIAAKPTSTPHAGFSVEVNNFGQVTTDGYVSGPISDTLRVRVAASTTQFGAWQKGYYLYDGKNGDQNKAAGRLLLDWTPTDRLTIGVNVNGSYDHGEAIQPQLAKIVPGRLAGAEPGLIGYPVSTKNRDVELPSDFDTHAHNQQFQGSLRVDYQLNDSMDLTSLTSYVKI